MLEDIVQTLDMNVHYRFKNFSAGVPSAFCVGM